MNKIEEIIVVLDKYIEYRDEALKGDKESAKKLYNYMNDEVCEFFNDLDFLDDIINDYTNDMKDIIIKIEGEEQYNKLKELEETFDENFDDIYYVEDMRKVLSYR